MTCSPFKVSIQRRCGTWSLREIAHDISVLEAPVALAVGNRYPLLFRRFVLVFASCRHIHHSSADRTLHHPVVRTFGLLLICSGGCLLAQLGQVVAKLLRFRFQHINVLWCLCVDAGGKLLRLRDSPPILLVGEITQHFLGFVSVPPGLYVSRLSVGLLAPSDRIA